MYLFFNNFNNNNLFLNFRYLKRNSENTLTDPDLCYENVAHFKRLIDSIHYNGPVVAMTDNIKLKLCLRYLSTLGCIISSVFSLNETKVNTYGDIPKIISNIKNSNAIAKNVRAYILQVFFLKYFYCFYYYNLI